MHDMQLIIWNVEEKETLQSLWTRKEDGMLAIRVDAFQRFDPFEFSNII